MCTVEGESGVMAKSPYQRIVRAAARGTGLRLSAEEIQALSTDTAISYRTELDDVLEMCATCLHLPVAPEGWHCAKRREAPFGACGDWKGAG